MRGGTIVEDLLGRGEKYHQETGAGIYVIYKTYKESDGDEVGLGVSTPGSGERVDYHAGGEFGVEER